MSTMTLSRLEWIIEADGEVVIARLSGSADFHQIAELERFAKALAARQRSIVVLELSELEFISSVGLGAFISLKRSIEAMSGKGRLDVSACERGGRVAIEVHDDGPGIDPAAAARLFEPFFTTKQEGAGLGLALVQRIVELHGGAVRVDPGRTGGAAFTLLLPAPSLRAGAAQHSVTATAERTSP